LPQYKTSQTTDDRQTDRQTTCCTIGLTDSTVGQKSANSLLSKDMDKSIVCVFWPTMYIPLSVGPLQLARGCESQLKAVTHITDTTYLAMQGPRPAK